MDERWSQEWRKDYDSEARELWMDMKRRVWRESRVFSGLDPLIPPPDDVIDADVLTEEEMVEIGDLGDHGDVDPQLSLPFATILVECATQIWRSDRRVPKSRFA